MPTYEITDPEGRLFRVTAPEGATQEEVLSYARANAPKAAPAQAKPEAEDPGALMAGLIGAGRVADRTVQGIKQAALEYLPTGMPAGQTTTELARMKQTQDDNTRIYAGLQEKRPLATMMGEIAPLVAALPAVGGIGSAAAIGALPGLIEYGTPEERLARGAMGAGGSAVGAGVGKMLGRAIQPFRPQPSQTQAAAQAAAQRLDVQLRPGEIVQSRPLRWTESALNDLPFSAGMAQTAEKARRESLNRAASRTINQDAPEITESVLAQARTDIGGTFDALLANRKITLDDTFRREMQHIAGSKVMKALRHENVDAVIAPFKTMPAGTIKVTGEWFQQNKTALDSAIRTAYLKGESDSARVLETFEKSLERAAMRSMSTEEAAAFKAAQKQWASLRLLETGKVVEGGNIMPGRLDQALTTRYKAAYKEGKIKGELADIGRLAQTYKPLPQSGTTPRAFYSGAASMAALSNPLATAAMLAAPPAMQKFLQSDAGRKYLTKGLLDITPKIDKRLMQGGYGLLGAPFAYAMD